MNSPPASLEISKPVFPNFQNTKSLGLSDLTQGMQKNLSRFPSTVKTILAMFQQPVFGPIEMELEIKGPVCISSNKPYAISTAKFFNT